MSNEFVRETCLLIRHDGMQTVRQDRLGKWFRPGVIAAGIGAGLYGLGTETGRKGLRKGYRVAKKQGKKAYSWAKDKGKKVLHKAEDLAGVNNAPKPRTEEPKTDSYYDDIRLDRRGTQDPERRRRKVGTAASILGGVGGAALVYAAGTRHGRQNVRKAYGYGRQKAGEAYGWAREQGRKARDKAVEITGFGEGKNKASTKS